MQHKRETYYDFIRGIAILCVIGSHTCTDNTWHTNQYLLQLINFSVPVFLALSGYFIGAKQLGSKQLYTSFLKKQIPRVYIPMVFWSIPWIFKWFSEGIFPRSYILMLSVIGGLDIMYFVTVIIQLYILTPIIQKFTAKHWFSIFSAITTGISIWIVQTNGIHFPLVFSLGYFPIWLFFYYLGVYFAKNDLPDTSRKTIIIYSLIIISLVTEAIEMIIAYKNNLPVYGGHKLSSHIFSCFLIFCIFQKHTKNAIDKIKDTAIINFIAYVGRVSFFVYLTHCLWLDVINPEYFTKIWIVDWFSVTSLTLAGSFIMKKYLPSKLQRYVGF